jgi:hypothetical protein
MPLKDRLLSIRCWGARTFGLGAVQESPRNKSVGDLIAPAIPPR